MQHDPDFQMALLLQKQFEVEYNLEHPPNDISYQNSRNPNRNNEKSRLNSSRSLTDPSWELVDPTPNIYLLFVQFNEKFFWNKLLAVSVDWSKRMTTCAGICSYQGRGGLCRITLSEPLLKLRPRKDLIETLLHEMIHAFLFVTHNNKDRDGHGPEFHKHMYRINGEAGTHITVYHDFHDEVRLYKQHWWRCDGPCVHRPPYFGMVRRATNRAPGAYDRWWAEHEQRCGGKFIKVKEPEKKQKAKTKEPQKSNKNTQDIRNFIPNSNSPGPLSNRTFNKTNTNRIFGKAGMINKNGTVVLNPKTTQSVNKENTPATITTNNGIAGFKDSSQNNSSFAKKSSDNVASSGNIVGFKDLAHTSGQLNSVNTFVGSGNTLTNTKMSSTPNQDYSVVRNHWLNKFSTNKQTSKSPELKRKSLDINTPVNKKQKSDAMASSTVINTNPTVNKSSKEMPSPQKDGICCPNCNKSVSEDEINSHLDTCLNADVSIQSEFSSDLNESTNNMVECPVCKAVVESENLNSHLDECLSGDSEEDFVETVPNKSDDNNCDNLKHCEICDSFIDSSRYDLHVQECLNSFYDNIETKYDLKNKDPCNETVLCLVCNKNIVKADLDSHLEECMVSVFDKDIDLNTGEEEEEDKHDMVVDLNESKGYNCPICMAEIDEENMNTHIDRCLNSAAMNEDIFN